MNLKSQISNLKFAALAALGLGVSALNPSTLNAQGALASAEAAQPAANTNGPTGTIPAGQGSFFNSVVGYFSAFNTNLDGTFGTSRGAVWTGVDSIQGNGSEGGSLANTIGISYDLWKPSTTNSQPSTLRVSAENVMRNGGVTGSVISEGAGVGLSFIVHDVRLTAYLDGVYNFDSSAKNQFCAEIGLRAWKALTEHTFAGVGIATQFPGNRQIFSAFLGFTF